MIANKKNDRNRASFPYIGEKFKFRVIAIILKITRSRTSLHVHLKYLNCLDDFFFKLI